MASNTQFVINTSGPQTFALIQGAGLFGQHLEGTLGSGTIVNFEMQAPGSSSWVAVPDTTAYDGSAGQLNCTGLPWDQLVSYPDGFKVRPNVATAGTGMSLSYVIRPASTNASCS